MQYLKEKSEINAMAANHLHDNNYYPSVIHCSYYSCLQLIKYILFKDYQVEEEEFEDSLRKKGNSHEVLANGMVKLLKKYGHDYSELNTNIVTLKRLRVEADYYNKECNSTKSKKSIELSKEITKQLIDKFQL